jgi:alpha-beta hydrolase superfamily lysophospholipase
MRRSLLCSSVAAALLLAACGSDGDSAADPTTDPTDGGAETTTSVTDDATPRSYAGPGPYSVGTIDLEVDPEHRFMVFYPLDEAPADGERFTYSGAELFGAEIAAVLPGAFRDPQGPDDAWVEAPPSADGPFPVVLYSHGASSYYRFSSLHNAHLTSHGYVVIAVDHPERGLLASFAPPGEDAETERVSDVEQLFDALDAVEEQAGTAGSVLEGLIDLDQIAGIGHSAGGRATGGAAYDDRIDAWIGQAPAPPIPDGAFEGSYQDFDFATWSADNEPPDVPSMIIASDGDQVIPIAEVQTVFDWLAPPKRLVVLDGAGHNAFTDICQPIQDEGGLAGAVEALGLDPETVPFVRLGEDGCTADNIPVADGWDAINHVTVAQLNAVFGIDAAVAEASLDEAWVQQEFPDTVESITAEG